MEMQLTGSLIADVELLLSVGVLLCFFFWLAVRRPSVGLACFIFLVLTRAHEYIPHSEVFRPSVLVGMIMLVGLFFHLWMNRQPLYFTGPQSLILVVFITVCWISLFTQGQTIYDPNGHILVEPLLLVFVSFIATLNAVRGVRDLRIILLTLLVIALTISLLTLVQSFVTGILHGRSWVYVSESTRVRRAGTWGIDPNEVGVTLATLLPLFFFLLENEKRSVLLKALYLLCIPLATLTIFLTYSRSGFICLVVAFLLIVRKRLSAKYTVGFVVLLIIIGVLIPEAFWERLVGTGTTDVTGAGRLIIWKAALNMIQAYPLTGIGYGQFYYLYGRYGGQIWSSVTSHNTYLGIVAETGIINLFIFLSLFLVTFWDLHRLKREAQLLNDTWTQKMCDTLNACLVIALISGLTLEQSSWIILYLCLALVIVLKRIGLQTHESSDNIAY